MTDNLRTTTDIRPGTYLIDAARSRAEFSATHIFGLKPVEGVMPVRSGTVVVADELRRSTVSAELEAAGFSTDDARRDKDVRGKRFLDAAAFPTIGFRSTQMVHSADGWRIVGVLSVRGGSTEVTLRVTDVVPTVDGYRIAATTTFDRRAVGVGGPPVGRLLNVRLTVSVTAV